MRTTRGAVCVFVALCGLCGCAVLPVAPAGRIPFPEGEYRRLKSTGTGLVRGQAFLKTRGGDVKTAAGNHVMLNPVTSYSDQWYEIGYIQGKPLTEPDPRLLQYFRKQIADAEGRFTFKNVPAGEYYLVSCVYWEAPVGYQGGLVMQGGFIAKRISVKDGDELDFILTR